MQNEQDSSEFDENYTQLLHALYTYISEHAVNYISDRDIRVIKGLVELYDYDSSDEYVRDILDDVGHYANYLRKKSH